MMRILGILLSVYCSSLFSEPIDVSIRARSAILMNAETGTILYEKDAHSYRYPASTTKIATALYALKQRGDRLNDWILAKRESIASISTKKRRDSNYTLPPYWIEQGGSHIGIKTGERLSLRTLLDGMLIASGNDAANVIAQYISGSIPQFVDELNAYLRTIGCEKTTFVNPHGHHHPTHRTTAYELALITKEALQIPIFRTIVKTTRANRPKTNKQDASKLVQTNRLIKKGPYYYKKAIGVKTGTGSHAKSALVAAADDGERTLIAVLLESEKRNDTFIDAVKLFEAAYSEQKVRRNYIETGKQNYIREIEGERVSCSPLEDYCLEFYPSEKPQLKASVSWYTVSLPIKKGDFIGEIIIEDQRLNSLEKIPLLAVNAVSLPWYKQSIWVVIVIGMICLVLFVLKRFE